MNYDFDAVIDRRHTDSLKWDRNGATFGTEDLLPMWVADTDFAAPPQVLKAMRERLDHGVFGYTFGGDAYHEAILGWVQRRYRWTIQREWIVFSPGIVPALSMTVLAHTKPGDAILIQPPVYGPFHDVALGNGRQLIRNGLVRADGAYRMDFESLERQITPRTRMLILCSPHNPVGRVWRREELERLAEIVCRHDLILISDEIHADLVFRGHSHTSIASLSPEIARRTLTCCAPSKTFGLAGLSTSYVIIPDARLRRGFEDVLEILEIDGGNVFGRTALTAAYTECDDWLAHLMDYLEANRDHAVRFFRERVPSIKPVAPEGTYLMWLDCADLEFRDGTELGEFLAGSAKVGLNRGARFGSDYEHFARLNFGCPRALLDEGLGRIERAVNDRLQGRA